MRAIRVLTAALLVLPAAVALGGPAAAGPAPVYTAVTGTVDPITGGPAFAYAASDAANADTANQLTFTANPASSSPPIVTVMPPSGGFVHDTTYTSSDMPPPLGTAASFTFSEGAQSCSNATWKLNVLDVVVDGSSKFTSFGAHYTINCNGIQAAGELRFNSVNGYQAVTQAQTSWDFGSQLLKLDGWAKVFTFKNAGSATQVFSSASTGSTAFKIKADTCLGAAGISAGSSCTITVVPHPTSTTTAAVSTLSLKPARLPALPALSVELRVLGSEEAPLLALAGPERVTLYWSQFLPMPIGHVLGAVQIWRGTSARSLSLWRTVGDGRLSTTDSGRRAGTTYYYRIVPIDGITGHALDRSPIVAARPWPKYSAGMYHRLPSAVRFVSSHRVSAGHPLALKVLGVHGVPSGHVSAVALNLTASSPSTTTRVFAYPNGTKRPAAADVAVRGGDTRSNFVLAKVGKGGRVLIATSRGSVSITVDVSGYFSASGLSSRYGQGGAPHIYGYYDKVVDTKGWHWGALKSGWRVDAVEGYFSPAMTPHTTSLIVEVTAFGSKGSGTLTGYATNGRAPKTSVLSYRPGVTTSTVAIIRTGAWTSPTTGDSYPSVSLLNRGPKPVQLVVTVIGFVDDNTLLYGQRYTPTAPVHLLRAKMGTGANRTISPGRNANYWTSGFNTKVAASNPTRTTTVSLRGIGLGAAPTRGQLTAPAHVSTVSTTFASAGQWNRTGVHNSAGTVHLDVWSFGRFDFYPWSTTTSNYASVTVPWREGAGMARPTAPTEHPVS